VPRKTARTVGLLLGIATLAVLVTGSAYPVQSACRVHVAIQDPYAQAGYMGLHPLPADKDGAIFRLNGVRYFQPVSTAQIAIQWLTQGRVADASVLADALIAHSELRNGGRLFPYWYKWEFGPSYLNPPWYSGMAQGQDLSVFVRLYEATGDSRYRTIADQVFATLAQGTKGVTGWVDGSWWIIEYPISNADPVLNGHVFGLLGLYDYWRVTGRGVEELCAAVAAVRDHIDDFRRPHAAGWYDLHHLSVANAGYQAIHVSQLEALAAITGDDRFREAASEFSADERDVASAKPSASPHT
jgi:hypothetical protein